MPPPPPPSKSYNLDLSAFSDSEDEQEDDEIYNHPPPRRIQHQLLQQHQQQKTNSISIGDNSNNINIVGNQEKITTVTAPNTAKRRVNEDDIDDADADDDDDDYDLLASSTEHDGGGDNCMTAAGNTAATNKKKKKKRNNKKRNKRKKKRGGSSSNNNSSEATSTTEESEENSLLPPFQDIDVVPVSDDDEDDGHGVDDDDDDDDDDCFHSVDEGDGVDVDHKAPAPSSNKFLSVPSELSTTKSSFCKKTISKSNSNKKKKGNNGVCFSDVSIKFYPRAFGEDVVPNDGGWPLGMELEPVPVSTGSSQDGEEHLFEEIITIDDYEEQKQQDLHQRWVLFKQHQDEQQRAAAEAHGSNGKHKGKSNTPTSNLSDKDEKVLALMEASAKRQHYETRQWDYRESVKNPLFKPSTEEERQEIFLSLDCEDGWNNDDQSVAESVSTPPPSSPTTSRRRSRSNSVTSVGSTGSCGSFGGRHDKYRRSAKRKEQFNEKYNQIVVHNKRNELEQIRNERSKTGCTCRKLNVYIPPKNEKCGKKANHRRLKPSKVTQELKKRHIYDPNATREEMEQLLHDTVEKEPCCGPDCFCVRNGIECAMDACSCWKVLRPKKKEDPPPSCTDIKKFCRGESDMDGMYVVSLGAIDTYRDNILGRVKTSGELFCQPIAGGE